MNETEAIVAYHIDLNFVCIKPDVIRRQLRLLAEMGYNAIVWEVEDKVCWDTCPAAIWPEAMGKEEFRDLLSYADSLGLEAIPLLQTVGHGEYILMQPEYRHLRELEDHHDCYCTERPEVRQFLRDLITEYLDVFGEIRYFHLGGDEAYVFAKCPVCAEKAEEVGVNRVYADHILAISEPIFARGVRPGIWCDMVLNHPEQMGEIPQSLVIWDWNYWDLDGPMDRVRVWGKGSVSRAQLSDEQKRQYPEILGDDGTLRGFYTSDALLRMGYDVLLCSAVRSSGDTVFCPTTAKHAANIVGAARKCATSKLLGTMVTDWAVRLNSWETHLTELSLAPAIMNNPELSLEEVRRQTADAFFGADSTDFLAAVDEISAAIPPFSQAHTTAIQWDRLKDSLPAPAGFIKNLLEDWKLSGRLEKEKLALSATMEALQRGISRLEGFISQARKHLETLENWHRAASFQLWQARMAEEILIGNMTVENVANLQNLKRQFRNYLALQETPQSAAKNASLVYDCLIEYMTGE